MGRRAFSFADYDERVALALCQLRLAGQRVRGKACEPARVRSAALSELRPDARNGRLPRPRGTRRARYPPARPRSDVRRRPLPQVPKGMCPWCGSDEREPYEDEWWCFGCSRTYPTRAHKCAVPTCWEYVFLDRYCERHAPADKPSEAPGQP